MDILTQRDHVDLQRTHADPARAASGSFEIRQPSLYSNTGKSQVAADTKSANSSKSPAVYLDHWAFRRFSENLELRQALASTIADRDGTLATVASCAIAREGAMRDCKYEPCYRRRQRSVRHESARNPGKDIGRSTFDETVRRLALKK